MINFDHEPPFHITLLLLTDIQPPCGLVVVVLLSSLIIYLFLLAFSCAYTIHDFLPLSHLTRSKCRGSAGKRLTVFRNDLSELEIISSSSLISSSYLFAR